MFRRKLFTLALVAGVVVSISTVGALAHTVSADTADADTNTNTGQSTTTTTTDTGNSCAVDKIGWILCPILEQSGKMADRLFNWLAGNFLEIEPGLFNGANNTSAKGAQGAWTQALSLANIAFIIAFVFIIISQVTNLGISNYGIKRMLPRLIVAAIAVNASYYICQIMVDLSNILGYNIMQLLIDMANNTGPVLIADNTQGTNTQTGDGVLGSIVVGILAVAGLVWLFISFAGAIIAFVVATVLIILVVLLLRKAFIILLVVMSPFAFVAYLLPNTEKYFYKWLDMFWKLLLVFPVVALLLGGGQLASSIILAAAPQVSSNSGCSSSATSTSTQCSDTQTVKDYSVNGEGGVDVGTKDHKSKVGWTYGLVATGIAVAPLLAVWSVLQGALSAAGAIGGKMTAAVSKGANKAGGLVGGGADGLKKKGTEGYKNSTVGQMRARSKRIREGEIAAGRYDGKGGKLNPRNWRSNANRRLNDVGRRPDGSFGEDPLGQYGAQRARAQRKADNEYIRDKSDDFAAAGNYQSKFNEAMNNFHNADNESDRHTAELEMQAAVFAASKALDTPTAEHLRQRFQNRSNGGGAATGAAGGGPTVVRPTFTGGGYGAASGGGGGSGGSQAAQAQTNRLPFESTFQDGTTHHHSGEYIDSKVAALGGHGQLSDSELLEIQKRFSTSGSSAHTHGAQNAANAAHDELARRGILPQRKP